MDIYFGLTKSGAGLIIFADYAANS